jgi:aminoglycoside N3'-acetyltransferase
MSLVDYPRAMVEVLARQVYWRTPRLASIASRRRSKARRGPKDGVPTVAASELSQRLHEVAARFNGLLMVHSSLDAFRIRDEKGEIMAAVKAALWLTQELTCAVGPQGTLCMPTHPLYPDSPGFMFDKSDLVLRYQVERTPSSVGLLTEIFRRTASVRRSAHPLSSLAVRGLLAEELLHDNLNDRRPLPHGRDSGYYRFCMRGGGVISLGLGVIKPLTILHVAEEVRDEAWPVPGFFYERQFDVREGQNEPRRVVVRERRPEFVRSLALSLVRQDLLREGVLEEAVVGGIRSDVVHAHGLLELYQHKQRHSTYPYFFPRLARLGRPPLAALV